MTVFKTFLRVLNQCKLPVIMYTVFLIAFGGFQMQTSESGTEFTASRPDIFIINADENNKVTDNLIQYMEENCNRIELKAEADAINDALFYRDVNYILSIPEHYGEDFLNGKNPQIEVRGTGDYQASYAQMLLSGYLRTANLYAEYMTDEEKLIAAVNETLAEQTEIEVTSKLNDGRISRAAFYYNFASYSMLAGCVYVICLVLSSFRDEKIRRRTAISSMRIDRYNLILLASNGLFAVALWLVYVLLSVVLIGDIVFSARGCVYILNSFVFMICALTIAFLIGNLVSNKNAVNGIVNVVALGSSFLCGAFVPAEWLPKSVLAAAHVLPSYWYIRTNDALKELETLNAETLKPLLGNMGVILLFSLFFVVAANLASRRKK